MDNATTITSQYTNQFSCQKNPYQMSNKTTKEQYGDYLSDPRWQRLRLEVMQRDNFTCLLCGDSRTTLNIHHTEYKGKPWEIEPGKLKTVCLHCHSILHKLPSHEITNIHKQISLNAKCWEVVAFTTTDIVFLYLFFATNEHTDRVDIITIFTNNKAA